jgi:hypothetical protein
MVSFSTVPYTEAMKAGVKFDRLILLLLALGIVLVGLIMWAVSAFGWWALLAGAVAGWLVGSRWNAGAPR